MLNKSQKWFLFWFMVGMGTWAANMPAQNLEPYRAIGQVKMSDGIQGSATLIATRPDGKGLALSCRHVARKVGSAASISWLWAGNQGGPARVVDVMLGHTFNDDLSMFECEVPAGVKPVMVVPFDPRNGPWTLAGFRGGIMRIVTAPATNIQGNMLIVPRPAIGGMSGGAMMDRHGHLVGVVVASDRKTMAISTDGPLLQDFVNKWRGK